MFLTQIRNTDLTGANPEFAVSDKRYFVFEPGQIIQLGMPAYAESIHVYKVNSDGSVGDEISMSDPDYGWSYDDSCRDMDAMSFGKVLFSEKPYCETQDTSFQSAKLYYTYDEYSEDFTVYPTDRYRVGDPIPVGLVLFEKLNTSSWDHLLLDRIFMAFSAGASGNFKISVSFQSFKKDLASYDKEEIGPAYSPGLMRSVINKLSDLLATRNIRDLVVEPLLVNIRVLEEDLTGRLPANYIENEQYTVNVAANKFVIRPQNGSFYKDDMKVIYVPVGSTEGRLLSEIDENGNGDYAVTGFDRARTAVSDTRRGVYNFVVFRTALAGTIYLTYHAFGGEVTSKDIDYIKEAIGNIIENIHQGMVTTSSLKNVAVIQDILQRIAFLEDAIKYYHAQKFVYTTGSVNRWVNIAYIPSSAWTEIGSIAENDIGNFRFTIDEYDYVLDIKTAYDAILGASERGAIAISLDYKLLHAEVGNRYTTNHPYTRIVPKFRLITNAYLENESDKKFNYGVMLQMCITAKEEEDCTVIINDRTSAMSPWVLVDTADDRHPESSETSIFPNGAIWTKSTGLSSQIRRVFLPGYSIFKGGINLSTVGPNKVVLSADVTGTDIVFDQVSSICVFVYDRVDQVTRMSEITDLHTTDTSVTGSVMYYDDDLSTITVTIRSNTSIDETSSILPVYNVELTTTTGSSSLDADRFVLTKIDVL